jgi:hypothetical protein
MDRQASDGLWPPRIGEYARVREGGVLGEVVDIECRGPVTQYTVNVLVTGAAGLSKCRIDDLSPVWPIDWTRRTVQ